MQRLTEIGGRRLPFLRWSVIRLMLGMRKLTTDWQVGDGREDAAADYVVANAKAGDAADAVRVFDEFCVTRSVLINVGDDKGAILDAAIVTAQPKLLLELGTYCGYSALRTACVMPEGAHLVSIEFSSANAGIARRILDHAGVSDRVTIVVGTLGDGGATVDALKRDHGFGPGSLDFVFIDHAKDAYLPDLRLILAEGWLHPGSRLVADNIKFPGVPDYHAYMQEQEGRTFKTTEHSAHVEYQSLLKDLVLESEYLGPA